MAPNFQLLHRIHLAVQGTEAVAPHLFENLTAAVQKIPVCFNVGVLCGLIEPVLRDAILTPENTPEQHAAAKVALSIPCRLGPVSARDLREVLQSRNVDVRLAVFSRLLVPMSDHATSLIPILQGGLQDPESRVRVAAVKAWRQLGFDLATEGIADLVNVLNDNVAAVRLESLAILTWLGQEAVAALPQVAETMLAAPEGEMRLFAFKAIAAIDPTFELVASQLQSRVRSNDERLSAISKLRAIGPDARTLRRLLQAKFENVPPANLDAFQTEWSNVSAPQERAVCLKLGQQTLASLYLLLAGPQNPSPTRVRSLAFRYALDPREDFLVTAETFKWTKSAEGWWKIEETPRSRSQKQPARSWQVKSPPAIAILDHVGGDEFPVSKLMDIIEKMVGGVPEAHQALPQPGAHLFEYAIGINSDNFPRVQLWIDSREVRLRNWDDAHKLLKELCENPQARFKGSEMESRLGISNASQAAKQIKESLGGTQPGADEWLLTTPIRWADGRAPQQRIIPGARLGRKNKKK